MGEKLTTFFKNQDRLGSAVNLNYRGTPKYSTILGGCLSLSASIFLATFVIFTVFDWAYNPNYTLQLSAGYLENSSGSYNPPAYEINTSNFLPTFDIRSTNLLTWKYYEIGTGLEIPTIPCNELINQFEGLKNDGCNDTDPEHYYYFCERDSILSTLISYE